MSTPVLTTGPEAPPPSANLANMRELMQKLVDDVAEESRARTTRYQQGQQWNTFVEWCKARGFQTLPADPETVALFIYTQGIGDKKPNPLRGYASSIAAEHRSAKRDSPCNDKVARVIKGFVNRAKEAGQREKRAEPLTAADLDKIRDTACNPRKTDRGMERPSNARRRGRVDIALISVMRDALLRRSEAAAIEWTHIATEPDGSGRLTIPWSKTDQQGEGVVLYLGPPTMKALDKIRPRQPLLPTQDEGEKKVFVFGLKAAAISERIAAAALAAGLGEGYSEHICRVGMAADLAEAGATMPQLQSVGRWKSSQTVARYVGAQFAGRSVVAHGTSITCSKSYPNEMRLPWPEPPGSGPRPERRHF